MGSGLQQFNYSSDVNYLFVPVHAQSLKDADIIRQHFPRDVSRYVQGSEVGRQQMMEIILEPVGDLIALSSQVWEDAIEIMQLVEEITGNSISHIIDKALLISLFQ